MNHNLMQKLRMRTIVQPDADGQGGNGTEPVGSEPETDPVKEGEPHGDPKTEDVDWKAMSRKWEERAKANKQAAEELEKLKEAQMSEQEKVAKRTREMETKLARYEAEKQQAEWREKVAKDTGVPASVLRGSTLEEMQEHAQSLKEILEPKPKAPSVPNQSGRPAGVAEDPMRGFVNQLFSEK